MLLGEPPRTAYDLNFSIAGFPVRIHPFFWIVAVLLGAQNPEPTAVLTWVAVVFVSILIHEMGHGLAFRYFGMPCSIVLYSFGGLAIPHSGFTSSFSSYNRPSNTPLGQIIISAAGPVAGFVFAGFVIAGLYLSNHVTPFWFFGQIIELGRGYPIENENVQHLVWDLLFVNIYWGILNLLPIYPLDGGQISREVFLVFNPGDGVRQSLLLSVITGGGIALYGLMNRATFMAIMFGLLAYQSFTMLQGYGGGGFGGGFGGGGFGRRPW